MIVTPRHHRRRAFTLIELLVVISILAILMTLLIPAVTGALEQAKKTQARNAATQLATAIVAYNTEYGRMPIATAGQVNDVALMKILSGQDPAENPRGITFIEVPTSKQGKNGVDGGAAGITSGYKDPWGNLFEIRVDDDYDNVIKDGPAGSGDIRKTVIVWSTANSTEPKKFVKSWE